MKNNNIKTIFLVRHAKSDHNILELKDFERPINKRGRNGVIFAGEKLKDYKIKFDQIVSSPSKRTYQTAELICEKLACDFNKIQFDNSIYESDSENLLGVIRKLDDKYQNVILIGHNPSLTDVSNILQSEMFIPNVPTSGIVAISFNVEHWKNIEKGNLIYFDYPKK